MPLLPAWEERDGGRVHDLPLHHAGGAHLWIQAGVQEDHLRALPLGKEGSGDQG